VQALEDLVDASEDLTMDAVSHKLCLIKRADLNDLISEVHVAPITDYIESKLALYMRNLEREDQVRLYKTLAATPSGRGMSGHIFEAYCLHKFQSRISIQLYPMVRLEGASETKRKPQWHTSHYPLSNKKLENKRKKALHDTIHLQTRPSNVVEYRDDELDGLDVLPDVFYIPKKSNEVALDAFIVHDGYLYIFQFTGGKKHRINNGLLPLLERCDQIPKRDKWRFTFVIPNDSELLRTPYPRNELLQRLKLFSSAVAVEFRKERRRKRSEEDDQTEQAVDLKPKLPRLREVAEEGEPKKSRSKEAIAGSSGEITQGRTLQRKARGEGEGKSASKKRKPTRAARDISDEEQREEPPGGRKRKQKLL